MKNLLNRLFILTLVFSLLGTILIPPTSASAKWDQNYRIDKYEIENNDDGSEKLSIKIYSENKKNHEFVVTKNDNKVTAVQYIDGKFIVKSVYDKQKGIVTEKFADGKKKVYNINELIIEEKNSTQLDALQYSTVSEIGTLDVVPIDPGSGYELIDSKYSSTWDEYGYLYEKVEETDTSYKEYTFGAGSAITTVLAVIEIIWTKGGLTAIFGAISYTFVGGTLDYAFSGSIDAIRERHHLKAYSQGELGLQTYRDIIRAIIEDDQGNIAYPVVDDGGDTRTNDELLDQAIYNVVLWNM